MNTPTTLIRGIGIVLGLLIVVIGIGIVGKMFLPNENAIDSYGVGSTGTSYTSSEMALAPDSLIARDIAPSSFPYYPIPYGTTSLDPNRQFITNSQFSIIVDELRARSNDLEEKAKALGGFATSSSTSTLTDGTEQAYLTLRVPADKIESLHQSIRSLALRIVDEQKQSDDATDQLVDTEARLKSLRESEAQYSEILKQATTVDEVLRITQERTNLRQQIEQLEAQQQNINSQVAFSTVSITMRTETGLPSQPAWRPLQQVKLAWQALLDGLTGTANLLIIGAVMIPLIALWLGLIWIIGKLGWRIIGWLRKQLFPNQ